MFPFFQQEVCPFPLDEKKKTQAKERQRERGREKERKKEAEREKKRMSKRDREMSKNTKERERKRNRPHQPPIQLQLVLSHCFERIGRESWLWTWHCKHGLQSYNTQSHRLANCLVTAAPRSAISSIVVSIHACIRCTVNGTDLFVLGTIGRGCKCCQRICQQCIHHFFDFGKPLGHICVFQCFFSCTPILPNYIIYCRCVVVPTLCICLDGWKIIPNQANKQEHRGIIARAT